MVDQENLVVTWCRVSIQPWHRGGCQTDEHNMTLATWAKQMHKLLTHISPDMWYQRIATHSTPEVPPFTTWRTTRWVVVVLERNLKPSFTFFCLNPALLRCVKDLTERFHTSTKSLPQVRLPASSTHGSHRWDDVRRADWMEIFRGPGEKVEQTALQCLLGSLASVLLDWQSVLAWQRQVVQRVLWISTARFFQPRVVGSPNRRSYIAVPMVFAELSR